MSPYSFSSGMFGPASGFSPYGGARGMPSMYGRGPMQMSQFRGMPQGGPAMMSDPRMQSRPGPAYSPGNGMGNSMGGGDSGIISDAGYRPMSGPPTNGPMGGMGNSMGGDTMGGGSLPFTPDRSGMTQVMDAGMSGPPRNPSAPGSYFGGRNLFDMFGAPGGGAPQGMTGFQNPGAASGVQNGSSPGAGIAPMNLQQGMFQPQSAPQGPPQSGPGSQVAYLQSLLRGQPGGSPAPAPAPDPSKVGNFGGSPNTWLYGPTPGALYPQVPKPAGTPNNFGYFPFNGTWGAAPGRM